MFYNVFFLASPVTTKLLVYSIFEDVLTEQGTCYGVLFLYNICMILNNFITSPEVI